MKYDYTKSEPGDRSLIGDPKADTLERTFAMKRMAFDGDDYLINYAADWLRSLSATLRESAVSALVGYLGLAQYVDDALRMLRDDADEEVRQQAASSLANFARRHPDPPVRKKNRSSPRKAHEAQLAAINRALAFSALHDTSDAVATEAYRGVVELVRHPGGRVSSGNIYRVQFDVAWLEKIVSGAR